MCYKVHDIYKSFFLLFCCWQDEKTDVLNVFFIFLKKEHLYTIKSFVIQLMV